MKTLISISILWIVFMSTYFITNWATEEEMIGVVKKVESDFEKEYGNKDCSIDWVSVSLWWVIYALSIQEWGRKDWTLWDKTNNRWSLHWTMKVKKVKKFVRWDWTKTRPVYYTAYDGIYEKAYMITHKPLYNKCNIWYKQLYAYIVWPNANPSKQYSKWYTNSQWISNRLLKLKNNAINFDKSQVEVGERKVAEEVKDWYNNKCRQKHTIWSWEYLQIDNKEGIMQKVISLLVWDKIFICKI